MLLNNIHAGLMVCDGAMPARMARFRRFMQQNDQPQEPFKVAFDYFKIKNRGLK